MSEPKFKIGQKVRVISKPYQNPISDDCFWIEEMNKFLGHTVTIDGYDSDNCYLIVEDDNEFSWDESWLFSPSKMEEFINESTFNELF